MDILGIRNRTENWKTARYFTPLYTNGGAHRLAEFLLTHHKATEVQLEPGSVRIELFWKGIRDHWEITQKKSKETVTDRNSDFLKHYDSKFGDLHYRVKASSLGAYLKKPWNYCVSLNDEKEKAMKQLGNNLINTEIDIVLEAPGHLLIGEAKFEEDFSMNTHNVLVHQFIRQYVMAKILLGRLKSNLEVVPFVVRQKCRAEGDRQIKFMVDQCWMSDKNVLTWEDIKEFWPSLTAK